MISKEQYYFLRNQPAFCQFTIEQFDQLAQAARFRKIPKDQLFFLPETLENISLSCRRAMPGLSSLIRRIPILTSIISEKGLPSPLGACLLTRSIIIRR